ncbi:4Fe-4S binding protein [uncultured Robinsoniella sp.]|uniref:4Fe-4S binding protein n=1 Tax=uncultured Robinsoniella sp. TaxID=904190 RepID=UPI00374FC724
MVKRKAQVNQKDCAACGACLKICPKSALSIYKGCYAQADEILCVGCGLCTKVCPTNAINIVKKEGVNL